jgi:hypothetical protein
MAAGRGKGGMIKLWVAIIVLGGLLVCSALMYVEKQHINRGIEATNTPDKIVARWNAEMLQLLQQPEN